MQVQKNKGREQWQINLVKKILLKKRLLKKLQQNQQWKKRLFVVHLWLRMCRKCTNARVVGRATVVADVDIALSNFVLN